jgi:hypothetical protein
MFSCPNTPRAACGEHIARSNPKGEADMAEEITKQEAVGRFGPDQLHTLINAFAR